MKEGIVPRRTACRIALGPRCSCGPTRRPTDTCSATRLVLAALLLFLVTVPATAQECISEVTVVYGGSSGIPAPYGYTKIDVDLNRGAGGDYIYVCYKKGMGAPITGLAVTLNNNPPPEDAAYNRVNVDLNRGAGGDFIWLWWTKDPSCSTVRNLQVLVNTTTTPGGYTLIPTDLNRDAGGDFIYFCYEER